jgi:cytochrome c556
VVRGARRGLVVAAVVVAALAAPGCAAAGLRPIRAIEGEFASRVTEEELSERLDRFSEFYAQTILESVRAITEGETNAEHRRQALVWQIQSIRTCRNVVLAPDPQSAFTDLWVLCVQQREFVSSPEFRERAGPRSETIAKAARQLDTEISAIGASFLAPADLERARAEVESFAREFPIREGFARAAPLPSTAGGSAANRLSWVTAIPMAPFKFVTGIDEGAAAIRHFSAVADRFARRIDSLPQETLWELELMLHDLAGRPVVTGTMASIESAARTGESIAATARDFQATADRFTTTVHDLPADVRKQLDGALADIESRQGELRATITEVRRALAEARDVVERADVTVRDVKAAGEGFDETSKSVADAARALEGTIRAWHEMMRELYPPDAEPKPRDPDKRPFDVLEWKQTSDSITKTASELRGALAEFRALAGDETVRGRAGEVARAARAEAEAAIDHAFVRALQLLGAIAVVVVAVRFVRPRAAKA